MVAGKARQQGHLEHQRAGGGSARLPLLARFHAKLEVHTVCGQAGGCVEGRHDAMTKVNGHGEEAASVLRHDVEVAVCGDEMGGQQRSEHPNRRFEPDDAATALAGRSNGSHCKHTDTDRHGHPRTLTP